MLPRSFRSPGGNLTNAEHRDARRDGTEGRLATVGSEQHEVDGGAAPELLAGRRPARRRPCRRRRCPASCRAGEPTLSPAASQRGRGPGRSVWPVEVGHHDEVDALRRHERDGRARGRPAVPAGRVADTTLPVGMSSLNTGSPTVTPSWIACELRRWRRPTGRPTSVGTVRGAGPVDTTSATSVSGSTSPPAPSEASAGTDHEITEPTGTSSSNCSVAGRATSCSSASVVSASASGQPGEVGQRAQLGALADDDEERLALGRAARRPPARCG